MSVQVGPEYAQARFGLILQVLMVLRILLDLDDIDDTPVIVNKSIQQGNEFMNDLDMNCASKYLKTFACSSILHRQLQLLNKPQGQWQNLRIH